ncbi:MAG: hypothetical protein RID91_15515, partial [Azospirillaceae bacterium]
DDGPDWPGEAEPVTPASETTGGGEAPGRETRPPAEAPPAPVLSFSAPDARRAEAGAGSPPSPEESVQTAQAGGGGTAPDAPVTQRREPPPSGRGDGYPNLADVPERPSDLPSAEEQAARRDALEADRSAAESGAPRTEPAPSEDAEADGSAPAAEAGDTGAAPGDLPWPPEEGDGAVEADPPAASDTTRQREAPSEPEARPTPAPAPADRSESSGQGTTVGTERSGSAALSLSEPDSGARDGTAGASTARPAPAETVEAPATTQETPPARRSPEAVVPDTGQIEQMFRENLARTGPDAVLPASPGADGAPAPAAPSAGGAPAASVAFDVGSAALSTQDRNRLRGLAEELAGGPGGIRVIGRAASGGGGDPVDRRVADLQLALDRANAVSSALIAYGVAPIRLTVDARPGRQGSEARDAALRRVEIFVDNAGR